MMVYTLLGLGGATALLGFLLLKAYSKIGELKQEVLVERLLVDDYIAKMDSLKQQVQANEEIDNDPISNSISDALDGMPDRGAED